VRFSLLTIVIGHATFCIVTVYNNVLARLRRTQTSLVEASMDLGADGVKTFRHVTLPVIATALVAGGLLALTHGLQVVGWIGGWSDPYFFKVNQPGGLGGLPPSPWLATVSMGTLLYGVLWFVGGTAWLRGRRWAGGEWWRGRTTGRQIPRRAFLA
jgi:hypothetical protein